METTERTLPSIPAGEKKSPDKETNALLGVNVLLEGASGSGKTFSIGTLVETGLEVFYLDLERGLESLLGFWKDRGKPVPKNLRWHVLPPRKDFLDNLIRSATLVNSVSYESLLKLYDPNRGKHTRYVDMLRVLNKFTDDRTGQSFEPVSEWSTNRALVVDSLTPVCVSALELVVGGNSAKNIKDWGLAQDQVEKFLRYLCDGIDCHTILLAHIEREMDTVVGGTKIMTLALGRALPPKIPQMFSDVILAVRDGTKFSWSTADSQTDLKTRNLSIKDGIQPDFSQIIEKWKSRKVT